MLTLVGAFLTVTFTVQLAPEAALMVMVVLPAFFAVTTPSALTEAMRVDLLV